MGNKIGIIYFSGTGNTKFVAQNIAKKLQQWGEELDLINIEKDKIIPTHYKYLIIGGPIYIDRYPEILIKYAKDNLKNNKIKKEKSNPKENKPIDHDIKIYKK